MKSIFVFASLLFCSVASAATSGSISAYYGNEFGSQKETANLGLSLGMPLMFGFGLWSWTGFGVNLENEKWTSHTQGLDFSIRNLTISGVYKASKATDLLMKPSVPVQQELGMRIKVKLW